MPTVAQLLAHKLYHAGVRTVFGLPGGETVEMLDALRERGIAFVLVKNESSAVYMADVTARLTGTSGVALTTLGPGATNAYAGIAHAYLDRAPVLLITAQTDSRRLYPRTHQVLDLQAVFTPVTKFTAELDALSAPQQIAYALAQLTTGRPGPVHLGVCNRVAAREVNTQPETVLQSAKADITPHVEAIIEKMRGLQRPVIVAGLGLGREGPYTELKALAEALQAPVIDLPKAKGALPARHPLFAGTIGLTIYDPAYTVLGEADFVLAVGFDVVELVKDWGGMAAPLVWIAPWPNVDPYVPAVYEAVGEMGPLLGALADRVQPDTGADWGAARVAEFRAEQAAAPLPEAEPGRILPQDVLRVIRENTPDDITITTDVGSHKIFTALNWQAQHPNRYFVSNGLSAMGFGVTAAIAAAKVTGEPAICITGDAGLAMVVGELSLAVEMNLPVIVVVMNDSALDLIRSAQHRRSKATFGTTFTNPDYSLIAAGYGLAYHRVDSVASCEGAIQS
ncbi:MAG: thiamine pyrophosphate-binding protein, partial [Chloroflexota bacterium]